MTETLQVLQKSKHRDYEEFKNECCYFRVKQYFGRIRPEVCMNHVVHLYSSYIEKYTGKLMLLVELGVISDQAFSSYQSEYSEYMFSLMKNFFLDEYWEKYQNAN